MRHTKEGDRLFKTVTLKLFGPEGERKGKKVLKATPGTGFTDAAIEKIVDDAATAVDKDFPYWDFRLVPVAPNVFNFVYAGLRNNDLALL